VRDTSIKAMAQMDTSRPGADIDHLAIHGVKLHVDDAIDGRADIFHEDPVARGCTVAVDGERTPEQRAGDESGHDPFQSVSLPLLSSSIGTAALT
jgi:hypothetical protein